MHPFYKHCLIACLLTLSLAACKKDPCPPDMSDIDQWEGDTRRAAEEIWSANESALNDAINDYIDRIEDQLANGDLTQVQANALIQSAYKVQDEFSGYYEALQQTKAAIKAMAELLRDQRMKDSGCNGDGSGGSGASGGPATNNVTAGEHGEDIIGTFGEGGAVTPR